MTRAIAALALLATVGCGGPQAAERPSVRGLLRNGQYAEAVAEAQRAVQRSPGDPNALAALAVAEAALAAPAGSPEGATASMGRAVDASSRGRALVAFSTEAAGSQAFLHDRFGIAARVALAPAAGWSPTRGDTDATRAAAALLDLAAHGAEHGGSTDAVTRLLETAAGLISTATNGFTYEDGDTRSAWAAFRAAGSLADAANRERLQSLAWAAAELAVQIAAANRALAIPIACDLGSPRDRLRDVLRYDRDALSRFEDAISDGAGCTPGTYAP